jgi:hypothetical protein
MAGATPHNISHTGWKGARSWRSRFGLNAFGPGYLERRSDSLNRMASQEISEGPRQEEGAPGCEACGAGGVQGSGERRFWRWTALGLGAIAIGKGMRLPSAWPYTQAQLNYSVGFMRRGLFGSVLGHPLGLNRYSHFAVVSTALLGLLFAALVLLARTSRLAERMPPGELLAVYASSYSVTYLAHLNGYLDIPLALLCVGALFVRSTSWRLAAAAVATIVGILIHEQFFFAFLPVLVISVAFGAATGKTAGERRVAWTGSILLAVLGIGLTWYLGRHGSISPAQTEQLTRSIVRAADRPPEDGVLKVLPRTPKENLEIMKSVWARPTFIPAQIESLLLFGPTAAVLSWATFLLLRRWVPRRHRWLYVGTLLATLMPLSLNVLGWDKNRWNELISLNAFVMLLVVSRMVGAEPVRLPLRLRRTCLIVMLLNMATGGGMLDNLHVRPFPFLRNPDAPIVESSFRGSHYECAGSPSLPVLFLAKSSRHLIQAGRGG